MSYQLTTWWVSRLESIHAIQNDNVPLRKTFDSSNLLSISTLLLLCLVLYVFVPEMNLLFECHIHTRIDNQGTHSFSTTRISCQHSQKSCMHMFCKESSIFSISSSLRSHIQMTKTSSAWSLSLSVFNQFCWIHTTLSLPIWLFSFRFNGCSLAARVTWR